MVVAEGEKILVIARPLYEGDLRRHFVGEVMAATESLVRVEGYTFVCDLSSGKFARTPEKRVRIFGLADSGIIVFVLPPSVNVEQVRYEMSMKRRLVLTEGEFSLDINEFRVD